MTSFNCRSDAKYVSSAKGAIFGLALGEALKTKPDLSKVNRPIEKNTDTFFKDSSGRYLDLVLAVNLSDSLLAHGEVNVQDQINRYSQWRRDKCAASTLEHFKIGENLNRAIERNEHFERSNQLEYHAVSDYQTIPDYDACLARIAPISVFFAPAKGMSLEAVLNKIKASCEVTHDTQSAAIASQILGGLIHECLGSSTLTKQELMNTLQKVEFEQVCMRGCEEVRSIITGSFISKDRHELTNATVVGSLESALWCFYHSSSFEQGALWSANVGSNYCSTSTVYGQLAGSFYGFDNLPKEWLEMLAWQDSIDRISYLLLETPVASRLTRFAAKCDALISNNCTELVAELYHDFHQENLVLKHENLSDIDYMLEGDSAKQVSGISNFNYTQLVQYLTVTVRNDQCCNGLLNSVNGSGIIKEWCQHLMKFVTPLR
ncbi:ADP-ribosylglycohydrolase family protein [Vibrio lamellibrachiae]|uniref:ADP-ribosylglycohydrolase family protein n=1 Tax=Vibrio lamellibrachiae TaxID=2910253 RepID=UPI003D0A8D69